MDEFKRKYSNEDTLTVALPHFWEHFDREGYSIWYGQYKYPEELTLTFKSCNLITGETQHAFHDSVGLTVSFMCCEIQHFARVEDIFRFLFHIGPECVL